MNKRSPIPIKTWMLDIFVVAIPFIMAGAVLLLNGHGLRFSICIPAWNDEMVWWNQVEACIKYGSPLGYYGYNGTHAAIGTWGPWGPFCIFPYALFGKIFGWKLYSMALANMTFLSLSLLAFLLLAKPDRKQKIWLVVIYCCSTTTVAYSITSMSEGLRYSVGIVLVSLLIWLERREHPTPGGYILIAIFVCYAVTVYMIFALVVPLFCWIFFKELKPAARAVVSLTVTGIVAVSANHLAGLLAAPYTSSAINNILQVIRNNGIYLGFCYFIDNFFNNLETVNLPNVFVAQDNRVFWFFVTFLIILAYLVRNAWLGIKNKEFEKSIFFIVPLWLMAGFLFGYCALYTGSSHTLCRGINTGLIMALLVLIHNKDVRITKILVAVSLLGIISTFNCYQEWINQRAALAQNTDAIVEERERLKDVIQITDTGNPWDNTVAHYGNLDYRYLSLPTGFGGNYMIGGGVNVQAKYALISRGDKNEEALRQMLVDAGHRVILEDDWFFIFINDQI